MHSQLGVLGVTGFLMQNLSANPLDYVEGGPLNQRRVEISQWLDSTDPDLSAFYKRGGKMIVTIGTDDTLASPGAQMDYFQSVLDKMGRDQVDAFARFFVIPQAGHGLSGRSSGTNGDGQSVPAFAIPNQYDKHGSDHRLGGTQRSSGQNAGRHRRWTQPAAVLVSELSALQGRSAGIRRVLRERRALTGCLKTKPKILIVGAGPAGLTAALHLHRRGFDVTVFESVHDDPPAWRWIESAAPRRSRTDHPGTRRKAGRHFHPDRRAFLPQQVRAVDLARAEGPERRLPLAAILGASRPAADAASGSGSGTTGQRQNPHRIAPRCL